MNKFDFAGTLIASGLILFANTTAQASEVRCADLHATTKPSAVKTRGQLTENYKTVRSFIENFYYLDRLLKILSASDKPTWEDYILIRDTIKAIKVLSKDGKGPLNSTEKEQLNADFDNMKSQLIENLKQIREKKTAPNEQFSYQRFLDYHISYFRMLEDVNRLLQFKAIPIPDLSAVKSDAVLKRDAKKILKNLENITDSTFHLSGHKNLKAFEEYAANYNELAKKSLDLIQNHLAVAMHRPEGARFWIPLAGFQNQRITGTSNGANFLDSKPGDPRPSRRDEAEATLTATEPAQYVPLSGRLKPNYAEARPDNTFTDVGPRNGASHYGSDLWIIKKSVIEERATWTPCDSLGPGWQPIRDRSFDDIFIPWKYRSLMVPFLIRDPTSIITFGRDENFKLENLKRWANGGRYFEVQVFGPLTIDDVQAFHFQGNPPNKELYDLLKSKNIEVWDERQWPPKPYHGENLK